MVWFAARDLPPSAERVLEILRLNGPLTHRDLVAATGLPPRTLRYALARLRSMERVGWRWSLRDARQRLYFAPRPAQGDRRDVRAGPEQYRYTSPRI